MTCTFPAVDVPLDSPLSMSRLQQWVEHYQSERRALRSEVDTMYTVNCVVCCVWAGSVEQVAQLLTHGQTLPPPPPPPHTHTHTHGHTHTHYTHMAKRTHTHMHAHTHSNGHTCTDTQNQELHSCQAKALQRVAEVQDLVGALEGQLTEEGEVHLSAISHKEEEISDLSTQVKIRSSLKARPWDMYDCSSLTPSAGLLALNFSCP